MGSDKIDLRKVEESLDKPGFAWEPLRRPLRHKEAVLALIAAVRAAREWIGGLDFWCMGESVPDYVRNAVAHPFTDGEPVGAPPATEEPNDV